MDPEALDALAGGPVRQGGLARVTDGQDGTLGADLAAALECLPEEYRSVVLLADLEDFSMGEIATIMSCPVGTVKSRLFRARGMLQALLRDYVR
jgi:RNA polymerase sigma-70 factor (ECF subfamily)